MKAADGHAGTGPDDRVTGLTVDEPGVAVTTILRPHRGRMISLAAASIVGGLLEAVFLVIVTRSAFAITDGDRNFGVMGGVEMSVGQAMTLALVLVAARVALSVLTTWQGSYLSAVVVADTRRDLTEAFVGAGWSAQHGDRAGRLQELLTTFAQGGMALVGGVMQLVSSGFTLVALLAIAIVVDPPAALVVILAVGALGSLLRPLRNSVLREAKRTAASGLEFATTVSEVSNLGLEMHVFGVQDAARDRVLEAVERNRVSTVKVTFLRGLVPAAYTGLAYVALVGAIAVVAAIESASLTSVGAVMLVMLRSLSYGQAIQTAAASVKATMPFLEHLELELRRYRDAAVVDHGQPVGQIDSLCLDDVSFEYDDGVEVLHGVTAEIGRCEVVGVIGPSGSGKSTLVQLLLGLRDPTSGMVLADGRDIRFLSRAEWARRVTFVPQAPRLIAGSIADNIRFLRPDVSDADVERAAMLANLHDDVTSWQDGYAHPVGEQGSHLSGGQQQRLVIARALVESPDVLILDEPTSSLDVRSEALVRSTLDMLRTRMTIVIIAHRLSTLEICDRIMVVQDGEVKAFDTPENLERENAFYREALVLSGLR